MSEDVRRDPLTRQAWRLRGRCLDILAQPESKPGGSELRPIAIRKHRLIRSPREPSEQCPEKLRRFRPDWRYAFLAALPHQCHLSRRVQVQVLWPNVERLLYSCSRVVEEGDQRMIALPFQFRPIRVREERGDLV